MSTTNHQRRGLMKAAIVLNNAAVALLEKGHSTKALRIFKTVVSTLQQSTRSTVCAAQMNQELRQAAIQVASVQRKKRMLFEVHIIEDDDDTAKQEAYDYGPSSSIGFVLRLGDHLYEQAEDRSLLPTFQYLTAAVLYNFAVAYRSAFLSSERTELLEGARQTLRSAQFLLLACAEKTDELYELYQWHVLNELSRNCLIQLARDVTNDPAYHMEGEAEYYIVDPNEVQYIQEVYSQQKRIAPAA